MKIDLINVVLPDELIQEIFGHLEAKWSRDACSLVCKRWLSLERLSRFAISISSSTPESYIRLLSSVFVNLRIVHIDERRSMPLLLVVCGPLSFAFFEKSKMYVLFMIGWNRIINSMETLCLNVWCVQIAFAIYKLGWFCE